MYVTLAKFLLSQTCFSFSAVCNVSRNKVISFSIPDFSSISNVNFSCKTLLSFSADKIFSSKVDRLLSKSFFSCAALSNLLFNSCKESDDRNLGKAKRASFGRFHTEPVSQNSLEFSFSNENQTRTNLDERGQHFKLRCGVTANSHIPWIASVRVRTKELFLSPLS